MNKQTFIIAVSGGVDSVVLLHMLMQKKPVHITYVVAHFDHGIREDSREDAELVEQLARNLQLQYEIGKGELGKDTSEAEARDARYAFLRDVAKKYGAEKIITAHHQDDMLETMVLNLLRGTGPRGLSPMNQTDILRPLIHKTKPELLDYAKEHELAWREDSTNNDEVYLRNYVRKNIMPKITSATDELLEIKNTVERLYDDIDTRIQLFLPAKNILYRPRFVVLPYVVQKEIVRAWLVKNNVEDIDRDLVERLVVAIKTLPHNKAVDIKSGLQLRSEKQNVLLTSK